MRFIYVNQAKELELKWMWLPLFIGQNTQLLTKLKSALTARFPAGSVIDDRLLDSIHAFIMDWLERETKIPKLSKYLGAIDQIEFGE